MTDKIRSCVSTCGKTRTPGQQVPAHSDRPLQGQPPRLTLRPPAHTQTPSVRTQHPAERSPNTSLVQSGAVSGSPRGTDTFLRLDAYLMHLPLLSQFLPQLPYNIRTHTRTHTPPRLKAPNSPQQWPRKSPTGRTVSHHRRPTDGIPRAEPPCLPLPRHSCACKKKRRGAQSLSGCQFPNRHPRHPAAHQPGSGPTNVAEGSTETPQKITNKLHLIAAGP